MVHRREREECNRLRLVEGLVLTTYEKRKRVTEIGASMVAHLTVVAAAVERDTVEHAASKVRLFRPKYNDSSVASSCLFQT